MSTTRLKYVATVQSGLTLGGDGDSSDPEWPYLRVANVQAGYVDLAEVKTVRVADAVASETTLRPGDILMTEGGDIDKLGRGALWRGEIDPILHQNHVFAVRPGPELDPRFLTYWLDGSVSRYYFRTTARKTTNLASTNKWTLGNLPVPKAALEEQRAIADYLDRETARIDTLIEEQQNLVETLRERRQSLISSSVAQGLEASVRFKESDLPGAGPVPEHWTLLPLRYAITFQEGPGIMAADFRDEGVPLLRVSCVRTAQTTLAGCNYLDPADVEGRWRHFQVDLGDLLISASASMGTVSEVTEEVVGAVPYTGIIRIKPGLMIRDFVRWFVVSGEFIDQVDSFKTGSTIQHFGPTHLSQMRVALPPPEEQRRIAAYLDEQTAKIDALIAETERFIKLSKERRAALITAAVTGQIDLRTSA